MAESIHLILRHAGQLRSETLADTRCQLFRIERFGKIIVRLQLESLQAVGLIATVGKEKDQDVFIHLADAFSHFKAIVTGHIDIEQYQIRLYERKLFQSNFPVSGISHFIAFLLKKALQQH